MADHGSHHRKQDQEHVYYLRCEDWKKAESQKAEEVETWTFQARFRQESKANPDATFKNTAKTMLGIYELSGDETQDLH